MVAPFFFFALLAYAHAEQEGESISFKPPELDEEEQESKVLPKQYRCDACQATAYQMARTLNKLETSRGPSLREKPLKEFEYLEALEQICERALADYGMKAVDGKNMLSGPGLPAENIPGMMAGGGKWPHRFSMHCSQMVGDQGEDEVYEMFRKSGNAADFFKKLCVDTTKDCLGEDVQERLESLNKKNSENVGSAVGPDRKKKRGKKTKKKRKKIKKISKSEL